MSAATTGAPDQLTVGNKDHSLTTTILSNSVYYRSFVRCPFFHCFFSADAANLFPNRKLDVRLSAPVFLDR